MTYLQFNIHLINPLLQKTWKQSYIIHEEEFNKRKLKAQKRYEEAIKKTQIERESKKVEIKKSPNNKGNKMLKANRFDDKKKKSTPQSTLMKDLLKKK